MIFTLIQIIQYVSKVLQIIVIADIILSYFMDPYSPIRRFLDRIVQPMLNPIRRVVPPLGMVDLSPLVLLIVIYLVTTILTSLLLYL